MASVPPEGEENPEPLKYRTWVLRVSIHCEGCKRKVKRILHSVDGVYTIDVDTKQHKVIVTGDVDSNTLIRKLEKSGKHAELWSDHRRKAMNNNDPYSQDHHQQQVDQNQGNQYNPTVNPEETQNNGDPSNGAPENSNPDKGNNGNLDPNDQHPKQKVKEVRFEENIPATGEETRPPEDGGGAADKGGVGGGSGGGAKKKKKRKGKSGGGNNTNNNSNGEGAGEQQPTNVGPPNTEPPPPQHGPGQGPYSNASPPRHPHYNNRVYEYAPTYYAPPPVYAVSYSTTYPSSYTASYYSTPTPFSYAYVHHGADVEPPPPSDTFEMFSDENPNACSVM